MLLADENVPAKTIDALRDRGIDILSVRERAPGLSDERVLALAVAERRVIVSFDRDYGELVFSGIMRARLALSICASSRRTQKKLPI